MEIKLFSEDITKIVQRYVETALLQVTDLQVMEVNSTLLYGSGILIFTVEPAPQAEVLEAWDLGDTNPVAAMNEVFDVSNTDDIPL